MLRVAEGHERQAALLEKNARASKLTLSALKQGPLAWPQMSSSLGVEAEQDHSIDLALQT
jgi:hypothetical protein